MLAFDVSTVKSKYPNSKVVKLKLDITQLGEVEIGRYLSY